MKCFTKRNAPGEIACTLPSWIESSIIRMNHWAGGRMAFEKVARLAEIPAGSIKEVQVEGQAIALANVAGTVYAISNTCLHRGGPLGEGQLEGKVVTCPWHGWQFDVTTGKAVQNPNAGVGCYAVEVRGEEVFVSLGQSS
jgi:nitrite reductase/ring-hydroxylating ferredoxin subunit